MKHFLKTVVAMKTAACLVYTAEMFFFLAASFLFRLESIPRDLALSLFLMAVIIGVLQVLLFTDMVIRNLPYTWRMVLFFIPLFGLISALAVRFEWFPTAELGAWGLFALLFLVIFVVMTLAFEIYFRITGQKYDGLLGQYRKRREQEK